MEQTKKTQKPWTGWHVLFVLLAMFGVIISVNVFFAYKAITTAPGEYGHAYVEGLKFNEKIDARHKQSALGWQMELGMQRGAGGDALFIASLTDKDKKPVTGANMTGMVGRTVDNKEDMQLAFNETKPGEYTAHVQKLGPGKWDFKAKAVKQGAPDFETETMLSIR